MNFHFFFVSRLVALQDPWKILWDFLSCYNLNKNLYFLQGCEKQQEAKAKFLQLHEAWIWKLKSGKNSIFVEAKSNLRWKFQCFFNEKRKLFIEFDWEKKTCEINELEKNRWYFCILFLFKILVLKYFLGFFFACD